MPFMEENAGTVSNNANKSQNSVFRFHWMAYSDKYPAYQRLPLAVDLLGYPIERLAGSFGVEVFDVEELDELGRGLVGRGKDWRCPVHAR
ncbi:MAG: hypothetical protein GX476_03700 [Firmicutes bacterium]|nr:hypothetical protein [Bacillota bacterium]